MYLVNKVEGGSKLGCKGEDFLVVKKLIIHSEHFL